MVPKMWLLVTIVCLDLAGCAGKLHVYDSTRSEIAGMPFRTAEVYVKLGTHNQATKGGQCDPVEFRETLSLPTGPQYYVTATTAQLAKTAFHIKYNEAGGVAEVGLDSEPAGAENIKATTDLIKTLAPLAGLAALIEGGPVTPPNACDAGEVSVVYCPLDQYMKNECRKP
jgi:hypothetical protein